MAITLFSVGAYAKTRELRTEAWEKHFENRLPWRYHHEKTTLMPKPATGLGKFEWKPVYHGDREETVIQLAKPFGLVKQEGLAKR